MLIRFADFSDFELMQNILVSSQPDWDATVLQDCLSDDYLRWVIEESNKIVGLVIVKNMYTHWELLQLVIAQEFQRRGLGRELLLHVIQMAKKMRREKIDCEVRASNEAAKYLYTKCGFEQVGERKSYYKDGEDAHLMTLRIE